MPLYNIAIEFEDGDPYIITRSHDALEVYFQEIHQLLTLSSLNVKQDLLNNLGHLTSKLSQGLPLSAQQIGSLLCDCFKYSDVVRSPASAHFLYDSQSDDASVLNTSVSAIDFLLQPFDKTSTYIARQKYHCIDIKLKQNEVAVYKFNVNCRMDIKFGMLFRQNVYNTSAHASLSNIMNDVSISLFNRLLQQPANSLTVLLQSSEFKSVQLAHPFERTTASSGSYTATTGGVLRLVFDNRYSALTGKYIDYVVQSTTLDTLNAALQASDDLTTLRAVPRSKLYTRILESQSEIKLSVAGPYTGTTLPAQSASGAQPSSGDVSNDQALSTSAQRPMQTLPNYGVWVGGTVLSLGYGVVGGVMSAPSIVTKGVSSLVQAAASNIFKRVYPQPATNDTPPQIVSNDKNNGALSPSGGSEEAEMKLWSDTPIGHDDEDGHDTVLDAAPDDSVQEVKLPEKPALPPGSSPALFTLSSLRQLLQALMQYKSSTAESNAAVAVDMCQVMKYIDTLENDIGYTQALNGKLQVQLQAANSEIKVSKERIVELENYIECQNDLDKQDSGDEEPSRSELQNELQILHEQYAILQQEYQAVEQQNKIYTLSKQSIHDEYSDLEKRYSALVQDVESHRQQQEQFSRKEQDYCERIAQLELQLQRHTEDSSYSPDTLARDEKLQSVTAELRDAQHMIDHMRQQLAEAESEWRLSECDKKQLRHRLKSEVAALMMVCDERDAMLTSVKNKLAKVKSERRLLINELRALKKRGVYDGPITTDSGCEQTTPNAKPPAATEKKSAPVSSVQSKQLSTDESVVVYDSLLHELREAREKEQTVSELLESDPTNGKLLSMFQHATTTLQSTYAKLQSYLDEYGVKHDDELPPHEVWLEHMRDNKAV